MRLIRPSIFRLLSPNKLIRGFSDLQRRGCVRTAFEFARLLYSLDPWTDPHGALLHLDYLAIKCGMGQWLLDLWDHFDESWQEGQHRNRVNVSVLPGWAYARALALRAREDATKDKVSILGLGFCEPFGGNLFVAIGSRSQRQCLARGNTDFPRSSPFTCR